MRYHTILMSLFVGSILAVVESKESLDSFLKSINVSSSSISQQDRNADGPTLSCAILFAARKDETAYSNETIYQADTTDYLSQTADNTPKCAYNPTSSFDVALAVRVLNFTIASFAIKGAGHTPFPGWAGSNGGVLIALRNLSDLSYDASAQTITTGAGNQWREIYEYAEKFDRLVVGGRSADVGTGLVLGGGLSHLSNAYGLSSDTITKYELITADGNITQATADHSPDLFFALKSGANNYGIVTRITMKAYPLKKVWGGSVTYNNDQLDALMRGFADYGAEGQKDTKSAFIANLFITLPDSNFVSFVYLDAVEKPAAFEAFYNIPNVTDTTRLHDNFTDLIGKPLALPVPRWSWGITTMLLDEASYIEATHIVQNQTAKFASTVQNGNMVLLPQPISETMVYSGTPPHGNPLGATKKAQMWYSINAGWSSPADDQKASNFVTETLGLIEDMTKARGTWDKFIFLNEAHSSQKPFASYGQQNQAVLRDTAKKYDPSGMFQTQVSGGFKVFA